MARVFRQQIDEGILDRAAGLFARHGFTQTSVQAVADAVGLSKAGLLHYFPSKEALREAVFRRSLELQREVHDQVADLPPGPERDRLAIETIVDQAMARPGLVSLTLGLHTTLDAWAVETRTLVEAFGTGPDPEPERLMRITGALGALSILVLAAHRAGKGSAWRPHVVATSYDALGHSREIPEAAR
ncbi:TetR/AcrR family transcriptional regulator [Actinocorallia herbida]|nr:helix-turn-helix domain-containing protein [Actinocorallia herbida]